MPHDPYKALYIHLPFCKHRCAYCDFHTTSIAPDNPAIEQYIERLVLEIRRASKAGDLAEIETVYIGGGTPSYLGTKYLSNLLYTLSLSMNLTKDVECSMEANPDSITPELIRDIYALGVNRLSIGVQSFDDGMLKNLDRIHDAEQAKEAVRMAQERFENVSVDLMCGIPGQSAEMFKESLDTAIDLGVTHVSIYPLTIEEHTPFYNKLMAGEMPDVDQDVQAFQMAQAEGVLTPHGYSRYEVASYAKEGYRCKHNIAYWTGVPYLGLGESAVTMTQNSEHRMRIQDGQVVDDLDLKQMVAEDLMMQMRMTDGVSDSAVVQASKILPDVIKVFMSLENDNLVVHEDRRYKPTFGGWLLGNELYGRIYELAP